MTKGKVNARAECLPSPLLYLEALSQDRFRCCPDPMTSGLRGGEQQPIAAW